MKQPPGAGKGKKGKKGGKGGNIGAAGSVIGAATWMGSHGANGFEMVPVNAGGGLAHYTTAFEDPVYDFFVKPAFMGISPALLLLSFFLGLMVQYFIMKYGRELYDKIDSKERGFRWRLYSLLRLWHKPP